LPAENTITDAISQITQEYKRLKKDAPKKQAPKIRGIQQTKTAFPKFTQTIKNLNIDTKPRPWVKHLDDNIDTGGL
jgi:hypothetical protein